MSENRVQGRSNRPSRRALGIAWFTLGLALIASDSGAGWVFFILGLTWTARPGNDDDGTNPARAHLVSSLSVALAVIAGLIVAATAWLKILEGV